MCNDKSTMRRKRSGERGQDDARTFGANDVPTENWNGDNKQEDIGYRTKTE